jgi:hypothetical protein
MYLPSLALEGVTGGLAEADIRGLHPSYQPHTHEDYGRKPKDHRHTEELGDTTDNWYSRECRETSRHRSNHCGGQPLNQPSPAVIEGQQPNPS